MFVIVLESSHVFSSSSESSFFKNVAIELSKKCTESSKQQETRAFSRAFLFLPKTYNTRYNVMSNLPMRHKLPQQPSKTHKIFFEPLGFVIFH